MNMQLRCVCGKPPGHAVRLQTTDADSRLDPTGTSKVRAAFARDMDRRWTQVKALLMKSIKDRFTNSGLNVSHAALTGQSPVVAFQAHVDEALRQLVLGYNGSWTARYVRDGAKVGAERAAKLLQTVVAAADRTPILQQLVISELRGICEATAQQMVRAYGVGLLSSATPMSTAQAVGAVIDKVGKARSRALVQFSIVRAHAMATLDGFRANGVTHVGTVAERTRSAPVTASLGLVRDAEFPSRKVVRAENKLKRVFGEGRVDILTASDPCPICEEISEEGPYTLDQAEGLIPQHPNCLCSYIPADDARYASVHDAPRLADSTTHIAAGVMILDPQGRALFLKRSTNGDHAGEWAFPAGAVEPGETAQVAAARETQEELGFTPTDLEQIDRRETDGVDFTTFGTMVTGKFVPTLDHEHTDWCWRALTNPPEPLHPGVRATVEHAVLGATADAFDPDEPRDPQGKWTTGGGAGKIDTFMEKLNKSGVPYWHHEAESVGGGNDVLEIPTSHIYVAKVEAEKAGLNLKEHPASDYGEQDPEDPHSFFSLHLASAAPVNATPPGPLDMSDLTKISGKKGSNEGGVYSPNSGDLENLAKQYYIKKPASTDHVTNELIAAKLYQLAGVHTLNYVPVKGGEHVATELEVLAKNNVKDLDLAERDAAKSDFAVHAWLANWDAVGTGGDNVGLRNNGEVVTLDTGGSLKYRAQGEPKGAAFGNTVDEINTLRDPSKSPDAAKLYGDMTNEQIVASINRVTGIPNQSIIDTVKSHGGSLVLASQLITRKQDLASQAAKMSPAQSAFDPEPQPTNTAPPAFKTKMEHAKYLLMKGTTSEELKKSLNWPAIGVPATAASLNLKLEKTKVGGAFFYKGTPMTSEEIKAAKGAKATKSTALTSVSTPVANLTPVENFKKALDENGVKYIHSDIPDKPYHLIEVLGGDTGIDKIKQIAKFHPVVAPMNEDYDTWQVLKGATPIPPPAPVVFAKATQAELDKAKKNTKLTAQYVPGAPTNNPAAQDLIDKFNVKWHGVEPWSSSIPEQAKAGEALLHEKVADFKKLQADMVPLAQAQQQAEANAKANLLSKAAAKKALAAKAEADKLANLHNLPEEDQRKYWLDKTTGGSASGYMASGENAIAKSKKLQEAGVTPAEVGFIKAFTGSYSGVNSAMRDGHMSEETFAFKHIMNDALAKMPPHDGSTVYRKISLDSSEQAKYQVGQIAHWKAFNSTSKNEGTWSGNTHFTIRNPKTGVDVQSISSHPSEAEVIMPADTYYRVLSKKQSGGAVHIEMEEAIPFGKKLKKVA